MQVDTFILLLLCFLFSVYAMIFIYMIIMKSILSICRIYSVTVYHRIERDIANFCVT